MPVDATAAVGAAQTVLGTIQSLTGASKSKKLLGQRTAYKTPQEFLDELNATQSNAQSGFDAFSLNYLTNQIDQSFGSSVDSIEKYGATSGRVDPNVLSSIFTQKVNALGQVANENHALMMDNFSKYLGALNTVGENKAAEWQSQQDIIKDKLQAASGQQTVGNQNISGGLSDLLKALTTDQTMNLYNPSRPKQTPAGGTAGNR